MPARRIFIACPCYSQREPENATAIAAASRLPGVRVCSHGGSLLARCFNDMWCQALNSRAVERWTHFVMLHSDIQPEDGWLHKLLDEMDRVDADVLSAVSPIKDGRGITSTGLFSPGPPAEIENLSAAQLETLPATFDSAPFDGRALVVNTGLMAVRFHEPWVEQCFFTIVDSIERQADGTFAARGLSEDWHFSLQCHRLKRRLFATQTVGLKHFGRIAFEAKARA